MGGVTSFLLQNPQKFMPQEGVIAISLRSNILVLVVVTRSHGKNLAWRARGKLLLSVQSLSSLKKSVRAEIEPMSPLSTTVLGT